MQLEIIVQALRQRCAVFSNNIAGAAQFKNIAETAALPMPFAFVVPLDDSPQESRAMNSVRQTMADSFAVIVAIGNTVDEKGQAAAHTVDSMRTILWAALLGWRPTDRYNGIVYEGGAPLAMDRARFWYQFEFSALMEIEPSDGWQDTDLAGLPHFDAVDMKVDALDPQRDPNVAGSGPDGRIEQTVPIPKTGILPT